MKLTKNAISAIKSNKRVRARLQLELDKSEFTIARYLINNEDNGLLTTVAALSIIRQETGLTDSQILETKKERNAA